MQVRREWAIVICQSVSSPNIPHLGKKNKILKNEVEIFGGIQWIGLLISQLQFSGKFFARRGYTAFFETLYRNILGEFLAWWSS